MKTIKYTLDTMQDAVKLLDESMRNCNIITFVGSLGAGKTTLISTYLKGKGVKKPVTSPTFAYMNIYHGKHNETYIHFDLYRLDAVDQFITAGFDEYLHYPNATVFIEWPEVIEPILSTMPHCKVHIEYADDKRILTVEKHG